MPFLISRRALIQSAAAFAASRVVEAAAPAPSRWALISDLHCPADPQDVYRGFYAHANLKKAVAAVAGSAAEFCAVSGDLARLTGQQADYETLRDLIGPIANKMPIGLTLGNHDNRARFAAAFSAPAGVKQAVSGKHVLAFEWANLRTVFLDSLLETNVTPGQLGTAQRKWLAEYVRADQRPVFLFVHHDFRERDGSLVDSARLLDTVIPARQVKAIFYGHTHEYGVETQEGLCLVNVPSTAYNFNDKEPVGWVEMSLTAGGAELLVHAQAGNTKVDGTKATLTWR